ERRQTLLFSATMPTEIRKLADNLLRNPVRVEVTPVATTAEKIEQSVYFVNKDNKSALLRHILADEKVSRVLVFTRTKHGADRLRRSLEQFSIPAEAIHGNKSQNHRQRSLAGFKDGSTRVLVATDLAARGIDVDEISHVVNYDLPAEPETYVHRIGRTARGGHSGISLSFCGPEDRSMLQGIERLIRMRIQVNPVPHDSELLTPEPRAMPNRVQENDSGNRGGQDGRNPRGQRQGGQNRSREHSGGRDRAPRHEHAHDRSPVGAGFNGQARPDNGNRRDSSGGEARRDTRPGHLRGNGPSDGNRGPESGNGSSHGRRRTSAGQGKPFQREYFSNDR